MKNQIDKKRCNDHFEVTEGDHPFDLSSTAWLVGQGIRLLQSIDEQGKGSFRYVVELLSGREDAVGTIIQMARPKGNSSNDIPLRWNLLYLLGQIGNKNAVEFLVNTSVEGLPEERQRGGCEGPNDGEMLVRTMAVEALKQISLRYPDSGVSILKIVSEHPVRPILIEAVKAAKDLGLKDKLLEILPTDDHWILDIRQARIEEVSVDPERKDTNERGFTPPKLSSNISSPSVACHTQRMIEK